MVEVTIDTSNLIDKTVFDREDFIDPAEECVTHLENMLNGILPFETLLVGIGSVDSKAAFQVNSTTKVGLPPRQTTTQRQAIATVPIGGMVYDTDVEGLLFQDGLGWHSLGGAGFGRASVQAYYKFQNLSVPSGSSGGLLVWGDTRFDTDNMHTDDGVGNLNDARITFNTAGKYVITLQISAVFVANSPSNGVGSMEAKIRRNGNNSDIILSQRVPRPFTVATRISIQTEYQFAQGDYIEAIVIQNSGVAIQIDANESHFSACLQPSANAVAFSDNFGTPSGPPLSSPYSGSGGGALVLTQTDGQFSIT